MSVTANIVNDWNIHFPILKKFTPTALFMKANIMFIGIRVTGERAGESYRIYLEIIPLWREIFNAKNIIIYYEMKDQKGRQLFIDYRFHDKMIDQAVSCANAQFGSLLQKNIPLSQLLKFLDFYLSHSCLISLYDYCNVIELKLAAGLYLNSPLLLDSARKTIEKESAKWDANHFFILFNKTIDEWKENIYREFSDREAFMARIKCNSEFPKIAKLNEAHIIDDLSTDYSLIKQSGIFHRIINSVTHVFKN